MFVPLGSAIANLRTMPATRRTSLLGAECSLTPCHVISGRPALAPISGSGVWRYRGLPRAPILVYPRSARIVRQHWPVRCAGPRRLSVDPPNLLVNGLGDLLWRKHVPGLIRIRFPNGFICLLENRIGHATVCSRRGANEIAICSPDLLTPPRMLTRREKNVKIHHDGECDHATAR
jgi:hypothetical protein